MADPVHDRLTALWRDVPIPPLAAVRARGEQRRTRTRAALAGGTAALAALGLLAGAALAGGSGGGPESLRPAPFATAPATPEPQPAPAADPAQLLDPQTVAAVRGGEWSVPQPDQDAPFPSLTPCPEGPGGAAAGLVRVLVGPGQQTLVSQVLVHDDAAAAQAAHGALVDEVERCPSTIEDSEDGRATADHVLLGGLPGTGPDRAYGTLTSRDCDDCQERVQHFSMSRVGSHLVLLRLLGGRVEELPPLADAAERKVRCATSRCVDGEPPVSREWEVTAGFLPPEQASAAEMPGWREVPGDRGRPILDPCGNGDTPLEDAVLDSDTTALGSQREAGGSSLTQQVLRYRSAAQAAEAFQAWSERVRTCRRESTADGDLTWSVVEGGRTEDTDEMAVRRVPCQAGACSDHFATYALVARVGDGFTLVRYEMAEDGDPAEYVRPLLIAVRDRLRSAVQG